MKCEGALDIRLKGLWWSSGAQIVVFPGEHHHTERCISTLLKEPSEPLESIQQGAHSPGAGVRAQSHAHRARLGTYAKQAQGTQQKELIPILPRPLVAVSDWVGVSVTACPVPSAEEFRHS